MNANLGAAGAGDRRIADLRSAGRRRWYDSEVGQNGWVSRGPVGILNRFFNFIKTKLQMFDLIMNQNLSGTILDRSQVPHLIIK